MNKTVPKLKDIAEKAGVSLATASLILRDEGKDLKFKSETRKRVLDTAKELGWRQNLLVKGIQTGKTKTVGVLVPPFDSFWSGVLVGIHREFAKYGYTPITLWRGDDTSDSLFLNGDSDGDILDLDEGVSLINTLLDRRVEAIIAWPTIAERYRKRLAGLSGQGIPLVLLEHAYDDEPEVGSIATDEEHGSQLVA
jgi:LacI family transcriptional regulator